MNNPTAHVLAVLVTTALGIATPDARAGLVTVDGTMSSLTPVGAVRIGTFRPGFDPFSYKYVYGVDVVGNMTSPNYSTAVWDGNFREIGSGRCGNRRIRASGTASGIEGQQLWVFVFGSLSPDQAQLFALISGTGTEWRAPSDAGSTAINADSADVFVFGSGGRGGPIELQGLPMPEPCSAILLSLGAAALALSGWQRRSRADRHVARQCPRA